MKPESVTALDEFLAGIIPSGSIDALNIKSPRVEIIART